MCTTIAEKVSLTGSGKGPSGWFALTDLYLSYDHPFHAPHEHALSLSFVNEAAGQRVAVELDGANARLLADRILAALELAGRVDGPDG
jgi:hypothetical protein